MGGLLLLSWLGVLFAVATGALGDQVVASSFAVMTTMTGAILVGWRSIRRHPDTSPSVVTRLLYLSALVPLGFFYAAGEFESMTLGLVLLPLVMSPMFTAKRHAWGIAACISALYLGLVAARHFELLPYGYMVPSAHEALVRAPAFLANNIAGFLILVFSLAYLAGQASLDIATSQQELEHEVGRRTAALAEANTALGAAQARSDELLNSILPRHIAETLKAGEKPEPQYFDSVSVLFADLAGFTAIAERLPAESLLARLDWIFSVFDRVVSACGLEKVKTIGDGYMAAGGLHDPSEAHASACVEAARGLLDAMARFNERHPGDGEWRLRIGIHSGPVVAGVIGDAKLNYDLWGDTVNTASRIEGAGEPGEINISDATRRLLGAAVVVRSRGAIEIKGKEPLLMHFVGATPTGRPGGSG